jgi:molybdenum cofactor cytidylyltransferase
VPEMANVGAILLAAGASQRFGTESKLLADIGGEPLVRRVARVLVRTGLKDLVVVTGHEQRICQQALEGLPVRYVNNTDWQSGMGSSIATGVSALDGEVDGAFIVPGDMPFLTAALLQTMAAEFARAGQQTIVFPATPTGEQRNPVLWPRRFFPKLMFLSGAEGAKRLLLSVVSETISVTADDPAVFADVDTSADLEAARALLIRPQPPPVFDLARAEAGWARPYRRR